MKRCVGAMMLIFLGIHGFAVSAAKAQGEAKPPMRTIRLDAMGGVKAKPDMAQISVGVVSEADTARAALDQNSVAMARVIEVLKASGLREEDIQTIDFSLRPRFDASKAQGSPPQINGYRAVNSVRITVRDLARLGEILDKVVSLGSNEIGGIAFNVADTTGLLDEARRRAMQTARRKAQLYAEAAGMVLGDVVTLDEQTVAPWRPQNFSAARLDAKAADAPIQPGEAELQVQISVLWELRAAPRAGDGAEDPLGFAPGTAEDDPAPSRGDKRAGDLPPIGGGDDKPGVKR